jgi:large subunit ribosomal protein L13
LPERIVEKAIQGMLPHNTLGRQLFRKLKVYRGDAHPHAAQQPQTLALDPAASAQ